MHLGNFRGLGTHLGTVGRAVGLAVALGTSALGCAVRAYDSEPVGYADVTYAPVDVEASPYVVYEGRPTYWYRDHWYYREGPNWRVYHREPAGLYRQRAVVARPSPMVARPGPVMVRPAGPPPVIARPVAPVVVARPAVRAHATVIAR